MSETPEQQVTVAEARQIAYRYLSSREHACKELGDKLLRKGVSAKVVSEALAELAKEGLVSDQRFAEAYTRSRVSSMFGPFKIRSELQKRGVAGQMIDEVLVHHESQWLQLAQQWILKRQGPVWDQNEKARLYRSGTRRGFSHEQMMNAFDAIQSQN